VDANRGRLSSGLITDLNRLMQRLSRTGLRHGDQLDQTFLPPLRKPIYVMLQDHDRAERLAKQLEFFGLSAQALDSVAAFRPRWSSACRRRSSWTWTSAAPASACNWPPKPRKAWSNAAAAVLQPARNRHPDPPRRRARRWPGILTGTLEASSLLEKIEVLTCVAQYEPYKVLIIDDSRAQALHTERLLNSAGIVTRP
jgi:hypothetical protein